MLVLLAPILDPRGTVQEERQHYEDNVLMNSVSLIIVRLYQISITAIYL